GQDILSLGCGDEREVQLVGDADFEEGVRLLENLVDNLGWLAKRGRVDEAASDCEVVRRWELGEVEEDERGDQGVPGKHDPQAVRVEECRDREERPGEQEQKRSRSEAEAQSATEAPVWAGDGGDGFGNERLHSGISYPNYWLPLTMGMSFW